MHSQITLDESENAEIQKAIPATSNKVYYAARARIYYAYPSARNWSYAGLQGAVAFVLNTSNNTFHFKMVDLDGTKRVIWDYELYDGLALNQEKSVTFFLSFEGNLKGDNCPIGFVFLDDSDAETFYNTVKSNKDVRASKLEQPPWIQGGNIDKSTIPHPEKGGLVHEIGHDVDSGSTSKGVDHTWNTSFEKLDVQPGKEVIPPYIKVLRDLIVKYPRQEPEEPQPPARLGYRNDASTPPPSSPAARTQTTPLTPPTIGPAVGYGQLPPEPSPPEPSLPTLALIAPDSSSRPRPISVSIITSHFASSTISARTSIPQQGSQPVGLPSEVVHEGEAEYLTSEGNQTAQLPSQSSQNGTALWILASRTTPHAPKKPVDTQFMAYMDNLRQQSNYSDARTSLTPPVSLIGDRVHSIASSVYSRSLSIASLPSVVEFSPTPVFKDEVHEELLMRMLTTN